MWLMTVLMYGHILNYFKWMKMENRLQLQDVLLMDFQQQDNYGEIHYTDGIIISKQIMIGG